MKVPHSNSLILIWRLSELEARHLGSLTIEPTHLLLGLCKSVDVDLASLFEKPSPDRKEVLDELLREVGRLRSVFKAARLDARRFRRALRSLSGGDQISLSESLHIRRSKAAKQVFAGAEHFAEIAHSIVFPIHLLYAVLSTKDETHWRLMDELGANTERLRRLANREAMLGCVGDRSLVGRN
jgi:ATP-dependent Clp protease ATP-binding subunit ClpA